MQSARLLTRQGSHTARSVALLYGQSCENLSSGICGQRRHRPTCTKPVWDSKMWLIFKPGLLSSHCQRYILMAYSQDRFLFKMAYFHFLNTQCVQGDIKKIILPSSYLLSNWRSWVSCLLCCDVVNISNDIKQIAHEISPICKAKITGSSLCVWWQRPESVIALSTINTDWAISLEVSQRENY